MSAHRIASRYAKSLLQLADESEKMEEVHADMLLLKQICRMSKEFVLMLKSPIINEDKKIKILELIFQGKVQEMSMLFFKIIVNKRREVFLPKIANAFIEQYNEIRSIAEVKLTMAADIDESFSETIKQLAKEALSAKQIDLTLEVDKTIIGGFILQYEDKLYDASVSGNLESLQQEFQKNTYVKKF